MQCSLDFNLNSFCCVLGIGIYWMKICGDRILCEIISCRIKLVTGCEGKGYWIRQINHTTQDDFIPLLMK